MKINVFTFMLVLSLFIGWAQAQQQLTIRQRDGQRISYSVDGIRNITFPSSGIMTLSTKAGKSESYTIVSLLNIIFESISGSHETTFSNNGELKLFPIPATELLNIALQDEIMPGALVELLGIDGRVYLKAMLRDGSALPVASLPEGLYLCRVINGTKVYTSKFIKTH